MSNHLAVAAVTRTMQAVVQQAAAGAVSGARVLTRRPDKGGDAGQEDAVVSLFLLAVSPNEQWRNQDVPRGPRRIALDLHYLLAFRGDETTFVPQRMLGAVVAALHAGPVLARDTVRAALDADGSTSPLAASDLADQLESLSVSLQPISIEELSRTWSVLLQVPYDLSVVYLASVVLIDATREAPVAPPVREDGVVITVEPHAGAPA
jgi:hypothetical protein